MDEVTGPIKRALSVLADSCLSIFAFSFLLSFDFSNALLSDLRGISPLVAKFSLLISFLLILVIVRLVFTVLFGVSLGQKIMGMHGTGNNLWKRVGGALRCLLEIFDIATLFVTSLPVLIHRRSLKEVLSVTALRSDRGYLYLFLSFIFIPVLFCMATISPMIVDLENSLLIKVTDLVVKEQKLDANDDFASIKNFRSNDFAFLTLANPLKSNVRFIPTFDIYKIDNRNLTNPSVYLYNTVNHDAVSMRFLNRLDLRTMVKEAEKFNPLFYMRYPDLALILAKDASLTAVKDYKNEYGSNLLLNDKAASQLNDLIDLSLGINFYNVADYALNSGIFIKAAVDLRLHVFNSFSDMSIDKVFRARLGSQSFFILEGKSNGSSEINLILISANSLNPVPIMLSGPVDNVEFMYNFVQNFFGAASWYFDYRNIFSIVKYGNELDPFIALEIINNNPSDEIALQFIYRELYDLAKVAINSGDESLKKYVSKALNRFVIWINLKSQNYQVDKSFTNKIQALKFSLKEGKL